jgi:hypothetical protein
MSYKRPRRIFVLEFQGEDYEGLEIRCKGISLREALALTELAQLSSERLPTPDDEVILRRGLGRFIECVISWNLEDDDGQAIAPSVDAVLDSGYEWALGVMAAWLETVGVREPSGPKENPSSSGLQSVEASLPMVT